MIKWFKAQTPAMRVMIVIMITSIFGIIARWEKVSHDVPEAFKSRVETIFKDPK